MGFLSSLVGGGGKAKQPAPGASGGGFGGAISSRLQGLGQPRPMPAQSAPQQINQPAPPPTSGFGGFRQNLMGLSRPQGFGMAQPMGQPMPMRQPAPMNTMTAAPPAPMFHPGTMINQGAPQPTSMALGAGGAGSGAMPQPNQPVNRSMFGGLGRALRF